MSYLTFSSPTSFTIAKRSDGANDGTVQYSTDKITWSTFTTTAVTSVLNGSNYEVYFRGIGNTYVKGANPSPYFVITGTNVSCNGNIETLLDYATVDAGNHPTMVSYCYSAMFRGCTSLTTAPALPATTLTKYCYSSMFSGCTSLVNAPALPATTLADYCYFSMFNWCTALTTAPALPATTLTTSCYFSMFEGCKSLRLSTTQTSTYTSPYRIPTSGTGTSGEYSLHGMFNSTGGTFTGTPSINTTYYLWTLISSEITTQGGIQFNTKGKFCKGNIQAIPKLQTKTATSNGTITQDMGYCGLSSIVVNVASDGTPVNIATAAEMDALLVSSNVGKVYQFTGTTDTTYTNGGLYEVIA